MDPTLTAQPNVLDQNCESRQTLDRVADKWSALVVYALVRGRRRHGQLRREIEGISQKMLTQTLRSMERDGLVSRRVVDRVPPHVEYELTALGMTLTEPLSPSAAGRWTTCPTCSRRARPTTRPSSRRRGIQPRRRLEPGPATARRPRPRALAVGADDRAALAALRDCTDSARAVGRR